MRTRPRTVITHLLVAAVAVAATLAWARPWRRVPPGLSRVESPTDTKLLLEKPLPEVRLEEVPLGRAVEELSRLSGVDIRADWRHLAPDKLGPTTPVSLWQRGRPLGDALVRLTDDLSNIAETPVCYAVEGDTIRIAELAHTRRVVRAYDVRDLVEKIGWSPWPDAMKNRRSEDDWAKGLGEALALIVSDCLASRYAVGIEEHGRYRYFDGRLLASHTAESDRRLRQLLEQFRAVHPGLPGDTLAATLPSRRIGSWGTAPETPGEAALNQSVRAVAMEDVPFEEAMRKLGELVGAPINVEWDDVEGVGISRNSLVTFATGPGPFGEALAAALGSLQQGEPGPLIFGAVDGVVTVTSDFADTSRRFSLIRFHYIGDVALPPRPAPYASPEERMGRTTRQEEIESLTEVIRTTVFPNSWRDNGGSTGSIQQVISSHLMITQTWIGHRKMEQLLATLRAQGVRPATQPQSASGVP